MKKIIFLDFNGTVLDDVVLCFNILNEMLEKRNKPKITFSKYKDIFTFPIIEYYKLAGLTFDVESFDDMAVEFINKYQQRSLEECKVYDGFFVVMEKLKKLGISVILCSASKYSNLIEQTDYFGITNMFDHIIGLDDIHARSKTQLAKEFIELKKYKLSDILFVGDTVHDLEVSNYCGCDGLLVASGHQSLNVLLKATNNCCESLSDIIKFL